MHNVTKSDFSQKKTFRQENYKSRSRFFENILGSKFLARKCKSTILNCIIIIIITFQVPEISELVYRLGDNYILLI